MQKNTTIISIDNKDLVVALVGLGVVLGAYGTYKFGKLVARIDEKIKK